jgi:hypothetical protein
MRSAVVETVASVLAALLIFAVIVTAAGALARVQTSDGHRPATVQVTPDPHP